MWPWAGLDPERSHTKPQVWSVAENWTHTCLRFFLWQASFPSVKSYEIFLLQARPWAQQATQGERGPLLVPRGLTLQPPLWWPGLSSSCGDQGELVGPTMKPKVLSHWGEAQDPIPPPPKAADSARRQSPDPPPAPPWGGWMVGAAQAPVPSTPITEVAASTFTSAHIK